MLNLIEPHLRGAVDVRFLAPGRSGAKVLLMVYADQLPGVIKLGPAADIEREAEKYRSIQTRLPANLRAPLSAKLVRDGDYAALEYIWAGGWSEAVTLRAAFPNLSIEHGLELLSELAEGLLRLGSFQRSPRSIFDLWKWENTDRIQAELERWASERSDAPRIKEVLELLRDQSSFRDAFGVRTTSAGLCHGDLNCHNILVTRTESKNPRGVLIDFASLRENQSLARDWTKLERDLKFRCLRDAFPNPGDFRRELWAVEEALAGETPRFTGDGPTAKVEAWVRALRRKIIGSLAAYSDAPALEYQYFSWCWALSHFGREEATPEPPEIQHAVLDSVLRAYAGLAALRTSSPSAPASPPALAKQVRMFRSKMSVAGSLSTGSGERRAIRLDETYVHREKVEEKVLSRARSAVQAASDAGEWISIVGNAGHGKSCLMWYLFKELEAEFPGGVLPIQAQSLGGAEELSALIDRLSPPHRPGLRPLVLIDTLDVVARDHRVLSELILRVVTDGSVVITTSRREEATRLHREYTPASHIELGRYEEREAKEAIRVYVKSSFPDPESDEAFRELQFTKLWNLLDQRRRIQELTFEPLILRMMFEVYVPKDIPADVNTQKVYQAFWDCRVVSDRGVPSEPKLQRERERATGLIARAIFFPADGSLHGDTVSAEVAEPLLESHGIHQAAQTIAALMSSGVLERGFESSLRFFHQTFLEYAAARDLLSPGHPEGPQLERLLGYVRDTDLFHVPVLKQLAIQDWYRGGPWWRKILEELVRLGTNLAANIFFEIAGKIEADEFCRSLAGAWRGHTQAFLESARLYPRARLRLAFAFAEDGGHAADKPVEIFAACELTFSQMSPEITADFLHRRLGEVLGDERDSVRPRYREALLACLKKGVSSCWDDLAALFPALSAKQKASALDDMIEVAGTEQLDRFMAVLLTLWPAIDDENESEAWPSLARALVHIHAARPAEREYFEPFLKVFGNLRDARAARWLGTLEGQLFWGPQLFADSQARIAGGSNLDKLRGAEALARTPPEDAAHVFEVLQKLSREHANDSDILSAILTTLSQMIWPDPEAALDFITGGRWPENKMGDAWKKLVDRLVEADPPRLVAHIVEGLRAPSESWREKWAIAFAELVKRGRRSLDDAALLRIYEAGLADKNKIAKRLARSIGDLARRSAPLAELVFERYFSKRDEGLRTAVLTSLAASPAPPDAFVIARLPSVIDAARSSAKNISLLIVYLEALKELSEDSCREVLNALHAQLSPKFLRAITSEKALNELLIVLKRCASQDPAKALELGRQIPLITDGVQGAVLAVYENVCYHTSDPVLIRTVLAELERVRNFTQVQSTHSAPQILQRAEAVVGPKPVVELVDRLLRASADPRSQLVLARAARALRGWGDAETRALNQEVRLPAEVAAVLFAQRRS